ncbi:MAG: peptidoglycan-binding protein [Clostridia bacterium]|nr:peptidoglycan-binding protein [Clostridia bacterium]
MIHMSKKFVLACLLTIAVLILTGTALADTAEVTASSLYLREEATSDSDALLLLRQGKRLEILGKTGHWYKVSYGSYIGYVYDEYVEVYDDGTMQKGDKNASVKAVQERLKELGYYKSTCDGNFGNVTVNAVKAFQKKNGLTQDGKVTEATLKKLNSASAIAANGKAVNATEDKKEETKDDGTLKKGAKGSEVKKLQQRLKELGYYKSTCDSEYGNVTVSAVKAFQKKNGLTADGVAGASTLKKLYASSAIGANGKTEKDEAKEETKVDTDDTLKQGAKGAEVKKVQQRLKELGYYTYGIDSDYGYRTVAAVKAFQKKNGLTADGVCGEATLKKMNSSSAIPANEKTDKEEEKEEIKDDGTLKQGAKGAEVKKVQQRLKELGYYTYGIDSDYGYRTVAAVKAFQKKNGLTADGVCGEATLKKLNSSSAIAANDKTDKEEEKEEVKDDGTLKKGAKGTAVKELQKRLKELGYYTYGIDGDYGDRTVNAVKAFQMKNGLTADGVCGDSTLKKLNSDDAITAKGSTTVELNTSQTLQKGDNGAQVKALQSALKKLGYYTNSLDSDYGYRTAEAVSAFQRANGLTVNGVANPATLRKLVSSSAISKAEADKKEEAEKEPTYKTENLDWFKNGYKVFPKRAIIEIKDVRTGLVFKAQVLYGTNHLDAEPLTKADTATLLKINGGVDFSWRRRPMLVKYNGHVYASSIYSEPHGDQTITDNNFDGQFCLHFYGSKTHGTGEVKQDHQECIAEALKATW